MTQPARESKLAQPGVYRLLPHCNTDAQFHQARELVND
jgi:hypothetical protein